MPIDKHRSLCKKNAERIVSRDRGNSRQHRGLNPHGVCDVTHYRVDDVIITQGERCDFILMNETKKIAYLIELKGKHVSKAVEQLQATAKSLQRELSPYTLQYRIVASKVKTHETESAETKRILKPWRTKKQVKYKTEVIEEEI